MQAGSTLGNTISNSRNITGNGRLNLETLYNHSDFLKKVNKKYSQTPKTKTKQNEKKNFQKELTLKADTTQTLLHNQRSKNLRVTALRTDGSRYPLRYKVVDNNKIEILSKDTALIKITVTPKKRKEDQGWYKTLQLGTRFLMMVRNISVNYTNRFNMNVPGFLPNVGNVFGQGKLGGLLSPGLDFAFGATDEGYINKAAQRSHYN